MNFRLNKSRDYGYNLSSPLALFLKLFSYQWKYISCESGNYQCIVELEINISGFRY